MTRQRTNSYDPMTICPTPSTLRACLDERVELTAEERAHVANCSRCTQLLEQLSADDDFACLRDASHWTESPHQLEPELLTLMREVREFLCSANPDHVEASGERLGSDTKREPTRSLTLPQNDPSEDSPLPASMSAERLESLLPGQRYYVQRILSSGGAGTVYLAFDNRLSREVAIKVLSRRSLRDRRRFQREAHILASMEHPHVVRVYDFGELTGDERSESGIEFLAMEHVSGGSLADREVSARTLGYQQLAVLMAGAARGVAAAHRNGLVHRDIKPANLLVDKDHRAIKVADFGLARHIDARHSQVTRAGDIVGTPEFMSPEQIADGDAVGPAADVYGLGATLYMLLTGHAPFRGSAAAVLRQVVDVDPVPANFIDPDVPQDLATICAKAMEKSPGDRYADAEALADDLERFAKGEPITARPVSVVGKFTRFLRRNPSLGIAIVVSLVLVIVLTAGSIAAAVVFARQRHELKVEAARAEALRRQSEQALAKSIDAADQLLLSVAQDTELLPRTPDSQAVSRKLLERAQSYFEALLKEYRGNPQLTFELARAHVGLAQIAQRLGDAHRVHHEVSEALKWMERIPPGRVASVQVDALRGEALLALGNAQLEAGEAKQAVSTFGDAVAACRHSVQTPPTDSRERLWSVEGLALRALAEAETTVGKHDAARGHLDEARERFGQLVAHYPGEASHLRDAALVDMSLSTMAIDRGDVDEGKQYLVSAAALLNRTGNALGHSLRVRELLGIIQINLGLAESRMGHTSESEQAFRTAIAEFRRLAELEPTVHSHKWKLVTASLNIGGPMLDQGREEEVVALWQNIVPVLDQLIEAQPESQRYVQVKAMLQSNIAIVLRDRGQAEEAIEPLTNATRILREQSRRVDDAPEAYLPVALNYSELATTYLVLERWAEALQALDRSDAICRELLEAHPDFESARGQWLDNMFARYKALQGKTPQDGYALAELTDQAVELARKLVSRQPEMVEYQVEWPLALIMRGEVRLAQSDLQQAYADGKAAIAHLTKRFHSPWTGRPRQAYRDASLLMASIVARELTAATDEATREAKRDELQQWLAQARKMGATDEEIQAIGSD